MITETQSSPRFVRRTELGPNEYRKNFHQIDREVLACICSPEADEVTPLMSKIYLRLVNAAEKYWERAGVLRIEAEVKNQKLSKAWTVLCDITGVASATARKAIAWMHEQGIIGYFSGKNGVGLRIFLNRAASSIGRRTTSNNQKILAAPVASTARRGASPVEPAFNDSFADLEVLDTEVNSRAPKNGANETYEIENPSTAPNRAPNFRAPHGVPPAKVAPLPPTPVIALSDVVARLRTELEPLMHTAARLAAAREHERTREWLENRGLPKAARVAQHEAYNVLKSHGLIDARQRVDPGRRVETATAPRTLEHNEIIDLAEACVALLETKGQLIERTLSEMSVAAGGFLLPEDTAKVRSKVNALLAAGGEGKQEDLCPS